MDHNYCINCGAPVATGARFCATCGAPAVDPEATRLAGSQNRAMAPMRDGPPAQERTIFTVRPTMFFIKVGYAAAALGAILLVILLALVHAPLFVAVLLGLALLLIPARYHFRRNTILYTLTDTRIEIDRGLVGRTTRNIPLRNVQDVTVSATIVERLLGFGDIKLDNASEQGGATMLHNINNPRYHADLILRELRRMG